MDTDFAAVAAGVDRGGMISEAEVSTLG